ncbi:AAA-like domain-containing protein [Argonema antarcticum]|uniref:AAA-like domain-containing protein n=1 Tax=Argonema antarcticum TaxID=2942763 RepID=UPI002012C95F|nr:AAA-like domain-containing protein [Argonema antarcticum]MCL1471454.1 AAA-like domain-containing protein [Argonema antarcticum A004/B2]
MNFEEGFQIADDAVFDQTGKRLNNVEETVIRGSCNDQTYTEMGNGTNYSPRYLQHDIAPKLWKLLTDVFGEKVDKKNCRVVLERRSRTSANTSTQSQKYQPLAESKFPEGEVPLDSPFYIDRPPIESLCYEEILQSGALIRIKGPRQMGKTSLMRRILEGATKQGYRTVSLNLRQAEGTLLTNLDKFLRWFCANISKQLQLEPLLNDYWDKELIGSMMSCTTYFQAYLLEKIDSPLILALDEVDRLFEDTDIATDIAKDFFALLRSWYEEAKNLDIWKKLRLVIVHSTEVYIPLKFNQSPFNVGLPVELSEFNAIQVKELARLHGLDWTDNQVEQIMAMVGGHPYLLRIALYQISRQDITLEQLIQTAATEAGIYSDHLRRHLVNLQEDLELCAAFKNVVSADNPVQLEPRQVYQLQKMGLVQVQGNDITPRCNLYRQYFCDRLRGN